jgi:hypothetical protein
MATLVIMLVGFASLGPLRPLAGLIAGTLLGWAAAVHFRRRFGGACRECLGAVIEVVEIFALVAMCVLAPGGGPAATQSTAAHPAPARQGPAPAPHPSPKTEEARPGAERQ